MVQVSTVQGRGNRSGTRRVIGGSTGNSSRISALPQEGFQTGSLFQAELYCKELERIRVVSDIRRGRCGRLVLPS
jgi:hypothetical protein